jgi:hypothetical protein
MRPCSLHSSGCSTSLRLRRQVARPSSGFVVVFVISVELHSAPTSPSPTQKTSPGFYVGNEGLPVGCVPDGPAKCFRVVGRYRLETFLRSACLEWLCQTLCGCVRYLDVSTLHTFKINIISPASPSFVSTTTKDLFVRRAFREPIGYPQILDIYDLMPLRGRHAYKASLRSALPDFLQPCLEIWVSLHFVRSRPCLSFFSLFDHQTSHATCFNARGLLYECVFDALLFSSSYRPVGKLVSHHVITRPTFSSFFFGSSYRPSCPPRCSDTTL